MNEKMSERDWAYHHHEDYWSVRGCYNGPENIEYLYQGRVFKTLTCDGYLIWNFAAHLYDAIPQLEQAREDELE